MRYTATLICVWIAVITLAVSVGGNIFQMSVVDPVWSASPPESVRTFAASPLPERVKRFHLNPMYAIGLICLLAAPFLAWNIPDLRAWLLLAVAFQAVILVGTFAYFYPMNKVLLESGSGRVDATTIVDMTHRWVFADRIRIVLRIAAFLSLIRAMTIVGRLGI